VDERAAHLPLVPRWADGSGSESVLHLQDRKNFGPQLFNELRFGINRTTASTSIVDTHPGLSISRVPGRPFGMLDIAGLSLIGNSPTIPLGSFSIYQVQEQVSRTTGGQTLKFGGEFRRIQSQRPAGFYGKWSVFVYGPESLRVSST
jgi:hypothetical protein